MMTTDQKLIEAALTKYPEEAVSIIDSLEPVQVASLLETLSWAQSCTILMALTPYKAGVIIMNLLKGTALVLLEHLPIKNASVILQQLDKLKREALIKELPVDMAKHLRNVMIYPKDTIGAHMEPCMALTAKMSVIEAIEAIKNEGLASNAHVYVLGKKNALVGYVDLIQLLSADPEEPIASIIQEIKLQLLPNFLVSQALEDWDYHFSVLPVADAQGMFLGTVARKVLIPGEARQQSVDKDAVQAGNALGDLYLIGLTSLFGTSTQPNPKSKK